MWTAYLKICSDLENHQQLASSFNKGSQSLVFNSGQKMALWTLNESIIPKVMRKRIHSAPSFGHFWKWLLLNLFPITFEVSSTRSHASKRSRSLLLLLWCVAGLLLLLHLFGVSATSATSATAAGQPRITKAATSNGCVYWREQDKRSLEISVEMFINRKSLNRPVLTVKRQWNGLHFLAFFYFGCCL